MRVSVLFVVFCLSFVALPNLAVSLCIEPYTVLRSRRSLAQNEIDITPRPCNPEDGWWRPGNTYNDPSTLITDSAENCCQLCRLTEECITWSRDRTTGACALKDKNSTAVLDDRYDSGFLRGTDASDVVERKECYQEEGVIYPKGIVLRKRKTQSHEQCCELCSDNIDCFSWHRNNNTRTCVLNGNVPDRKHRSKKKFCGASII